MGQLRASVTVDDYRARAMGLKVVKIVTTTVAMTLTVSVTHQSHCEKSSVSINSEHSTNSSPNILRFSEVEFLG